MTESWREVATFLGEENMEQIKSKVTDCIIENLVDSVEHYWVVPPDDMNYLVEDIINTTVAKVIKSRKKEISTEIEKKVNAFIDKLIEVE